MEIIETKSILPHLLLTMPIGFGTTAVCFLTTNNEVIKVFYNSDATIKLFNSYDMLEHIKLLSDLTCDTYNGPTKVLVKNDKVLGYIYPYIYMQTLSKLPYYANRQTIINGYGRVLGDVKKMSEEHFRLMDVHHKNILIGSNYKLIDIDKGYQDLKSTPDDIFIYDMRQISKTIIEEIFKLKIDEHLSFEDEILQKYYLKTLYDDPYEMFDFISRLFPSNNDTLRDVQKKVRIKKFNEDNCYHKSI